MDLWVDTCILALHIQKATDVDCSKLHVVMEAVQAFLKVTKLTE